MADRSNAQSPPRAPTPKRGKEPVSPSPGKSSQAPRDATPTRTPKRAGSMLLPMKDDKTGNQGLLEARLKKDPRSGLEILDLPQKWQKVLSFFGAEVVSDMLVHTFFECNRITSKDSLVRSYLFVTDNALYLGHADDVITRCIPIKRITQVFHSASDLSVAIVVPSEYDLLVRLDIKKDREELLAVIRSIFARYSREAGKQKLDVEFRLIKESLSPKKHNMKKPASFKVNVVRPTTRSSLTETEPLRSSVERLMQEPTKRPDLIETRLLRDPRSLLDILEFPSEWHKILAPSLAPEVISDVVLHCYMECNRLEQTGASVRCYLFMTDDTLYVGDKGGPLTRSIQLSILAQVEYSNVDPDLAVKPRSGFDLLLHFESKEQRAEFVTVLKSIFTRLDNEDDEEFDMEMKLQKEKLDPKKYSLTKPADFTSQIRPPTTRRALVAKIVGASRQSRAQSAPAQFGDSATVDAQQRPRAPSHGADASSKESSGTFQQQPPSPMQQKTNAPPPKQSPSGAPSRFSGSLPNVPAPGGAAAAGPPKKLTEAAVLAMMKPQKAEAKEKYSSWWKAFGRTSDKVAPQPPPPPPKEDEEAEEDFEEDQDLPAEDLYDVSGDSAAPSTPMQSASPPKVQQQQLPPQPRQASQPSPPRQAPEPPPAAPSAPPSAPAPSLEDMASIRQLQESLSSALLENRSLLQQLQSRDAEMWKLRTDSQLALAEAQGIRFPASKEMEEQKSTLAHLEDRVRSAALSAEEADKLFREVKEQRKLLGELIVREREAKELIVYLQRQLAERHSTITRLEQQLAGHIVVSSERDDLLRELDAKRTLLKEVLSGAFRSEQEIDMLRREIDERNNLIDAQSADNLKAVEEIQKLKEELMDKDDMLRAIHEKASNAVMLQDDNDRLRKLLDEKQAALKQCLADNFLLEQENQRLRGMLPEERLPPRNRSSPEELVEKWTAGMITSPPASVTTKLSSGGYPLSLWQAPDVKGSSGEANSPATNSSPQHHSPSDRAEITRSVLRGEKPHHLDSLSPDELLWLRALGEQKGTAADSWANRRKTPLRAKASAESKEDSFLKTIWSDPQYSVG